MLFGSSEKWWGDGRRDNPHEGLDFCFYRSRENTVHRLEENTKIPAMFDGAVARIIDDFLGKTVMLEHKIPGSSITLYSIYGHVIPDGSAYAGSSVKQGDVIAVLAGKGKSKAEVFPHLHITLGYPSGDISCAELNWNTISDPEIFKLIDPLNFISGSYRVEEPRNLASE